GNNPPAPPPPGGTTSLLEAHNAQRAANGLPPLTADDRLASAAQQHATEMFNTGVLTHQGKDGSMPWDRTRRAGYTGGNIGENIAKGQTSVDQVMASWMNSPSHRANILGVNYKNAGFGQAGDFWCAVFGG